MEEQDYILFDQYLLNDLSAEEREVFQERLNSDVEFNKSFNTYKELSHFLENKFEANDFKSTLESISNKHFIQTETIVETKRKTSVFRLAIAASVIIFLGVFTYNQFSDPTYSDFADYDSIDLTVRGNQDELLTKAEKAFNNKKYEEAELLFNQILMKDPSNLEVELYKSITLIETGQSSEADELLWGISKTNSAYKNKAKWYWALSKLKQKENEACVEILKTILEDAEDYKQAQKLLNKLE